ncbi:MAG: hypothetical protein ACR2HW_00540 [Gemmatimonadales bacterium]
MSGSYRGSGTGRNERGIALIIAVFSLAVIGALIGGIFFAARLEQQSGRNVVFAAQAGEAAEAGLSHAVATLDPAELDRLPLGATPLDLGTLTLPGGASVSRQAHRITRDLFLIRVRGVRQDAAGTTLAMRSVGLLMRLHLAGGLPAVARLGERAWVQLY